MILYPIQFIPILKERIWGGSKLKSVLSKEITSNATGESWEISTVPDAISVVKNGFLKGKNLNEIIALYPLEILGERVFKNFGTTFPLLFKFLDAKEDLSIQLHPNDSLAKKRHNSLGKTEMWYIMHADQNARIVLGFKQDSNQKEYLDNLNNNTLINLLEEIPVKKGDVFFLETGTIHAIGAGILLAEIQQTSDITYRVYDWDRKDDDGNGRELHTELALKAINFKAKNSKILYTVNLNAKNELVHCPFFKTNNIIVENLFNWNENAGSFTVFMCTEGNCTLEMNGEITSLEMGQTVLIPASVLQLIIVGNATLLEIYL